MKYTKYDTAINTKNSTFAYTKYHTLVFTKDNTGNNPNCFTFN